LKNTTRPKDGSRRIIGPTRPKKKKIGPTNGLKVATLSLLIFDFFFSFFLFNQIFFFFDFFFLHFLILSQFDPLAARSKDSSHLNNIEETAAGLLRLVEAMRAVGH